MTAIHLAPLGFAGGLAIVWGLLGLAFWILLAVLIALLVRGIRTTAQASGGPAVRLLEERYARGEIPARSSSNAGPCWVEDRPPPRATTRLSA